MRFGRGQTGDVGEEEEEVTLKLHGRWRAPGRGGGGVNPSVQSRLRSESCKSRGLFLSRRVLLFRHLSTQDWDTKRGAKL